MIRRIENIELRSNKYDELMDYVERELEEKKNAGYYIHHYSTSAEVDGFSFKYYCSKTKCSLIGGENVLLAATEARNKTQENIHNCVTTELHKLSEQIDNAIAEGKYSISNDGYLQSETQQRLEELGYKIQTGSQYNESYYSISWK